MSNFHSKLINLTSPGQGPEVQDFRIDRTDGKVVRLIQSDGNVVVINFGTEDYQKIARGNYRRTKYDN